MTLKCPTSSPAFTIGTLTSMVPLCSTASGESAAEPSVSRMSLSSRVALPSEASIVPSTNSMRACLRSGMLAIARIAAIAAGRSRSAAACDTTDANTPAVSRSARVLVSR